MEQDMSAMLFEQAMTSTQAQIDGIFNIASTAFSGWSRLADLNLETFRAGLARAHEATTKLLDAQDLPSLVAVQASLAQPAGDAMQAYYRETVEIVANTRADVASAMLPMVRQGREDAQKSADVMANEASRARDASWSAWQSVGDAAVPAGASFTAIQDATRQLADAAEEGLAAQSEALDQAASSVIAAASSHKSGE
jgi:phasin family protein